MWEWSSEPWPWYVAGPLVGLTVPILLLIGGRKFGLSSNMRHICAAVLPTKSDFLCYDWKGSGLWNLIFAAGIVAGGWIAGTWLGGVEPMVIAEATTEELAALGLSTPRGAVPVELFDWRAVASLPGFVVMVVGGFLVGFGARWAGGCTSGHAISGLADLQLPSLIAVLGFFAGGLVSTHFLLPLILG